MMGAQENEKDKVREEIANYVGEGVHVGLRKWCGSKESAIAWDAINKVPSTEWAGIATEITNLILSHPSICVLDENQSLPEIPKYTGACSYNSLTACGMTQQDMLDQGWRKVIDL